MALFENGVAVFWAQEKRAKQNKAVQQIGKI